MRRSVALSAAILGGIALWRRAGRNSSPAAPPPGGPRGRETRLLEAGAFLLQGKAPLGALNHYLDGFHFYADDLGRQVEAHHYCCNLSEDLTQCVIFDGNTPQARLIGVEYIVSERLFATLPAEERRLWHSHDYEVASGLLIAHGLPRAAEKRLMRKIAATYGKVWHTWDTGRDELPLGIPSLMMSFTADGQVDPALLAARDARFGISTAERRRQRRDLPAPEPLPGADDWRFGRARQLRLEEREMVLGEATSPAGT